MSTGFEGPLYILAFDHRTSFERLAGGSSSVADVKHVIWEGFQRALSEGVPRESAGVLIDAYYGAAVAREARANDILFAMPVEKSGHDVLELEPDWRRMLDEFDPTFAKVLVRYNPDGDAEANDLQRRRLRLLSDEIRRVGRSLILELLVPATEDQLVKAGGLVDAYDRDLLPELIARAIRELQDSGVEPHLWKVEGVESRFACERISKAAKRAGRDNVSCLVLGRGAGDEQVDRWLQPAAATSGYAGFAIGRSIYADPLKTIAGHDRDAAVADIARGYRRFVEVWRAAAAGVRR